LVKEYQPNYARVITEYRQNYVRMVIKYQQNSISQSEEPELHKRRKFQFDFLQACDDKSDRKGCHQIDTEGVKSGARPVARQNLRCNVVVDERTSLLDVQFCFLKQNQTDSAVFQQY